VHRQVDEAGHIACRATEVVHREPDTRAAEAREVTCYGAVGGQVSRHGHLEPLRR
jgi:hypothetical protein